MATEGDFHFISFVNSASDELPLPQVRPGFATFFRDSWLALHQVSGWQETDQQYPAIQAIIDAHWE
jgi:hypothetical protein